MQLPKYFLAFHLFFISCQNNTNSLNEQKQYDFEKIETILKGETLKKKHNSKNDFHKASNYSCNAIYVGNNKISDEINLVFKSANINECFESLNFYYNTYFNSTNKNKKFNSWSTDSLEVLLFKQTDSTILVNIFIKTYR